MQLLILFFLPLFQWCKKRSKVKCYRLKKNKLQRLQRFSETFFKVALILAKKKKQQDLLCFKLGYIPQQATAFKLSYI